MTMGSFKRCRRSERQETLKSVGVRPSWYFNLFTCSNFEKTVILKSIFLNVGIHTFIGTHKESFGGKVILMTSISYCSSFPIFSRTGGFNFTPGNMGESINFEIERWKNYNICNKL
jgi:hypothetical protein